MDSFLHRTGRKTIRRRVPLATVSQMVVAALKVLKHPDGCTLQQVCNYVSVMHGSEDDSHILDKVPMALQRGVQFGAIKQSGNFYKLDAIMVMALRTQSRGEGRLAPRIVRKKAAVKKGTKKVAGSKMASKEKNSRKRTAAAALN